MKVPVIRIGNSKGIRLGKAIIDRYHIQDAVEMEFEKEQIIIKPTSEPRTGWEEAFVEMNANKDDHLLMDDIFEDENLDEWK